MIKLMSLLNEDAEPMYSQIVGSFGANLVGKRISVSNGESLHGGSFSGDYLVIGYGSFVDNPTKDSFTQSDANQEILLIKDVDGSGQQIHDMLFHAKDIDNGKVTVL